MTQLKNRCVFVELIDLDYDQIELFEKFCFDNEINYQIGHYRIAGAYQEAGKPKEW